MRDRSEESVKTGKDSGGEPFSENCYEWREALISAVIIIVVVFTFFFRIVNVSGPSMLPTLESGARVLISSALHKPDAGDVVVITRTPGL